MHLEILIVDDNEIIRNLLNEILSRQGYETIAVADGVTALEIVENRTPQIALVDLYLPDISGIEVIKEIRKLSPSTESVIITGHSTVGAAKEILDSNAASGLLEKPIDLNKLLELINNIRPKVIHNLELQESLQKLEQMNNQLEFLNTIIFRDFEMLASILNEAINMFEHTDLSKKQKEVLQLLKTIRRSDRNLIKTISRVKSYRNIDSNQFVKVDLIRAIEKGFQLFQKRYPEFPAIDLRQYHNQEMYVKGLAEDLMILFQELFTAILAPMASINPSFQISLRKSKALQDNSNKKIPTIEIELTVVADKTAMYNNLSLTELESQEFSLGFFLVKNISDSLKGKIFLEDDHKEDFLTTNFVVYLPSY
jgi:CheY-like chemotaxis protein